MIARWLLWLLGAAWLLFALLVVVLHGWIVPRIGEWRGEVEAQASRVVGVPVRIGSIEARSSGLFPSVELKDVRLEDEAGRAALTLARATFSVSPRSLWRLGFEQLYLEKPEVDMRLAPDGRFFVAGLDLTRDADKADGGDALADWFFSQREVVISQGALRWTDEKRGAPPLQLQDVHFIARNSARRHQMRLDATPPEGWGERFTITADFRQALLSTRAGDWQRWRGQAHAQLPHIDVTRLGQYVTLDARIREGDGALQAWIDFQDGQPVGGTVDLALSRVNAVLGAKLQPLVLRDVTGRISAQRTPESFEFSTENLQFITGRDEHWPGGNLWFRQELAQGNKPESGALRADRLDLGALALIADRLPLGEPVRRLISSRAPQGLVEHIELGWQGPADAPTRYNARGRVASLALAGDAPAPAPATSAASATAHRPPVGTPGVRGLSGDFELNQDGGQAQVQIADGALEFPGVFEEPVIPLDSATARAQWKIDGERVELSVPELRFANADAEGTARATWHTADAAQSGSGSRFPGVLDLQGTLTRADGTRVWRYLPLEIPEHTRHYVRDAVRQGTASNVDFRVRGDLWDMPFNDPKRGDFRIAAQVRDVQFAYVPPLSSEAAARAKPDAIDALPWPALAGMAGELVFERSGMQVRGARGHLAGAPSMQVSKGEARIADMAHADAVLTVDAQMRGPLPELTRLGVPLLRGVPDAHDFVSGVQATGNADYRYQMQLPLSHMDRVKVQASVALPGNELRLAPGTPAFTRTQGQLQFTESGFSLKDLRAQLAGGGVQLQGQGRWDGAQPDITVQAQGRLSAEGLRGLGEWPWLVNLAGRMDGDTAYSVEAGWRDGRPHFLVQSDLQGLGLRLPAPLDKAPGDPMPLRVAQKVTQRGGDGRPTREQFTMSLGDIASADYLSELSGDAPRLLQGAARIGAEAVKAASLPDSGSLVAVTLPRVDVDAWRGLFGGVAADSAATTQAALSGEGAAYHAWMPSHFAVHAGELVVAGRTLRQVVAGGTREGAVWRANVDARELSGYVEYSVRQAGRLHARLARLKIEASAADQVESLLDTQPETLPALDVVVDRFELLGRDLGRVEIEAVNRGGAQREWRLNHLSLQTPEARFKATGRWTSADGSAHAPRNTALDFQLDIQDAGALLTRFGMKDVLRRGEGSLAGQVQWQGSPFSIDYPSLAGQMHLDVQRGQFLKAEPGIAKLLGVLSLQALPRRFTLDFRDLFSAGFAFDFIRGDARIASGVAHTNNLQMKGVNAAVLMEGWADIAKETQQLRVVVVPEINAGTAALVATAINPAIGLGAFLAQAVLSRPLVAATTREFEIDGTWADPRVTQVPRRAAPATTGTPAEPPTPATPATPSSGTGPLPKLSHLGEQLQEQLQEQRQAPRPKMSTLAEWPGLPALPALPEWMRERTADSATPHQEDSP